MGHLFLPGTKTLAEPANYTVSLNTPVDHRQSDQAGEATVSHPLWWSSAG